MKKILFIFLFLLSIQIHSQSYKYAILSGINSGEELAKIISDINSKNEISFLIVLGNITKTGTDKELHSSKEILDKLKIPYMVIPGKNETENGIFHFNEIYGKDKFFYKKNGDVHIGLNNGIDWNGNTGHFYPEEINWLEEILKDSVANENIFLYSYYPLDKRTDNWFKVINKIRNFKIKAAFSVDGEIGKITNLNGLSGIALNTEISKFPGYFLITSNNDSIIISQINASIKKTEKSIGFISKVKNYETPKVDSTQLIDYDKCILWNKNLNSSIPSPIEATANRIFLAARNGNVFCFDINGNKLWENNTGETITGKPAVYADILSAGTLEGDILTLNINNGNITQTLGIGEPLTSDLMIIDASYQGEKTKGIVAGSSNGKIFCYDINSLENIWENNSAGGMIKTYPLLIEGRMIFGSSDGYLYCISSKSGILNWKWKDRNQNSSLAECTPVSDGKNVFVTIPGNSLNAIDLLLGVSAWKLNLPDAWESLSISSDNEKLYVKGSKSFYIVSAKTGKLIKESKINYGEDFSPVPPVEWNNNILLPAENGNLILIDPKYNWKKLFFAGTARLNKIKHVKDNIFTVSNIDGEIIVFQLNK